MTSTTDPSLTSWIESANEKGAEFPIQSLPWGAFRRKGSSERPRLGVPIGDQVLELKKCVENGLLAGIEVAAGEALCEPTLNALMALGPKAWTTVRSSISELLRSDCARVRDSNRCRMRAVVPMDQIELAMPVAIGDYTDFYASVHHATNVGSMFRPDNPLMPNYKHLPVGYHGRASSIVLSGTPIRRPSGQTCPKDGEPPVFGPSKALDYELEVGFFVGRGNTLGTPIPIASAREHIFGLTLVNDWSARDVQKWEYQPLGPFNAKNFGTTISPWVMQLDALEPFLAPAPKRAKADPELLPYLKWSDDFLIDLKLEVRIQSASMRDQDMAPVVVSKGTYRDMYWTFAQMLAHHTSTGCNLRPGDLLASGTVSGPDEDSRGCLLERTWRGEYPIELPDGTKRAFLQDGDEVIIAGYCQKRGATRISLGECRGRVVSS
ncbi:MAG: fumarylacetoacetase [Phycisphaerales bacterium]|nr:fumarylacetoacetase [Phycisphaerales bacterium]